MVEIQPRKSAARTVSNMDSEALCRTVFDNVSDCLFLVRVEPDGEVVYEAANRAYPDL